jgi:drug/metabolite transporter (DMT)-like permease
MRISAGLQVFWTKFKTRNQFLGALCAIGAYAGFSLFDMLVKLAGHGGYPQWQVMATVAAIAIVTNLLLAHFIARGSVIKKLRTEKLPFHLVRGALGLLAFGSGLYSLKHISLIEFYGIIFTAPIMVALMSYFWLKETVSLQRWIAILCGFIGVLLMLRLGIAGDVFNKSITLAHCAAFNGTFFGAVSALMVKRYGKGEGSLRLNFYPNLVIVLAMGSMLLFNDAKPYGSNDFIAMLAAGMILGIAGKLLMVAFQNAPLSMVTPFQYTQLVWGVLLGYFVFGDQPDLWVMVGASIIMISGWFMLRRETAQPAISV